MTAPTLEVRIDWDDDGTFEGGIEDVTAYVFGNIEITRGRDQVRALSPPMAPQLTLVLDNGDGRFWPDNVSSPLYDPSGLWQHRIRVTATHSAVTYTMFTGLVTDWAPDFDLELVTVTAIGGVEALVERTITTPIHSGIRTGEAIDLILDEIDWPAGASYRDVDLGSTILPWWWETNGGAYPALMRVLACEGSPARIDVDVAGKFIFEDRHHRLLNNGGAPVVTFRDTGAEPLMTRPFGINLGWDTIINDVTIPVEALMIGDEQIVGTWMGSQAVTGGGSSVVVTMNLDLPTVYGPVNNPTVGNGGIMVTGLGSVTGSPVTLTSAQTATVQLQSPDFDATVTEIHLLGRPLLVARSVDVTYTDAASVTDYGSRGIPGGLDAPFLDEINAEVIATVYVEHYREPRAQAFITIDGADNTRLPHQLGRDVSDRVRVIASDADVDRSYYIEQVGTTFNLPHPWTTTRFGLEQPPTFVVNEDLIFILDSSTQGKLGPAIPGQGRLGL